MLLIVVDVLNFEMNVARGFVVLLCPQIGCLKNWNKVFESHLIDGDSALNLLLLNMGNYLNMRLVLQVKEISTEVPHWHLIRRCGPPFVLADRPHHSHNFFVVQVNLKGDVLHVVVVIEMSAHQLKVEHIVKLLVDELLTLLAPQRQFL